MPSTASRGWSAPRRSRSSARSRSMPSSSGRPRSSAGDGSGRRRRTEFQDADGMLVAWVHIDWVLIDGRGAPTRIPAEFDSVFGAPPASFGLARVTLGDVPSEASRTRLTVRPQELDPMDHVNNAVYADWLDEAVQGAGGTSSPSGPSRGWPVSSTPGRPRRVHPSTQRCGRTAMPGRAGSRTTTATCSAPGSSRSTTTGRGGAREPGPRSGLRAPTPTARRSSRRSATTTRPSRSSRRRRASARSSPRRATSCASGRSRANGRCSNASATSSTRS